MIPISCAAATTFAGPTRFVSCAKTVLSEYAIAFDRSIGPRLVVLEVGHAPGPSAGVDHDRVRDEVDAGRDPVLSAAASTNGLNADPGCRSPWVARLNWLSW